MMSLFIIQQGQKFLLFAIWQMFIFFIGNNACMDANLTHHMECGTGFHLIDNMNIKHTIQLVLEAISYYDSFDDL